MPLATRHMKDTVTVWIKAGYDENDVYADESYNTPIHVKCEYMTGGTMQRDNESVEFQPSSTIYSVVSIPFSARVLFGVHNDATPPSNAEIVRKQGFGTALRGQAEYEAFTG